jgi:hypothetical protein
MWRASRRLGSSLLLTFALAAPATINCASTPRRQESGREAQRELDRTYDRNHGDYHSWNDKEEGIYRQFLATQHREYRVFSTLKSDEQKEYWAWRHSHSEADHDNP